MSHGSSPARARRARRALTGTLVAGTAALTTACAGISPQQEQELGADYAAQINAELPIVQDPALNRYINQLGRRIAPADRAFPYHFYIVNAEQVNAFAIPGGHVYVNRGLVERTDDLSELAGVLAHEIGHVAERHSVEQIERAQSANLGINLAYILMGRTPSGAERAAIGVGGGLVLARYSREAENEADAVAIPLLVNAGIHPRGLLSFFHELLSEQSRSPSALETWFSTHPTTEDRIATTEARLRSVPDARLRGLATNTADFQSFKRRLAGYPPPPPEYRVGSR